MSLTLYVLVCSPLMALIVLAWFSHRPVPVSGSAPVVSPAPAADVADREESGPVDTVQVSPEREPEPALR